MCFYLFVWFLLKWHFWCTFVILFSYGDYIQHPAVCLFCMCCFGVNYNVVICKVYNSIQISFSAADLQCSYNQTVNIYIASKKITTNTTTDFVNKYLVGVNSVQCISHWFKMGLANTLKWLPSSQFIVVFFSCIITFKYNFMTEREFCRIQLFWNLFRLFCKRENLILLIISVALSSQNDV